MTVMQCMGVWLDVLPPQAQLNSITLAVEHIACPLPSGASQSTVVQVAFPDVSDMTYDALHPGNQPKTRKVLVRSQIIPNSART